MSRNGVVPSRNACVLRGQIAKTNSTGVGPPNALPPVWVLTKDRWPSDTYIFHVQPPGWEMLPMCCVLCVLTVRRPQTKTLLSVICAISATTLAGLSHIPCHIITARKEARRNTRNERTYRLAYSFPIIRANKWMTHDVCDTERITANRKLPLRKAVLPNTRRVTVRPFV